MDRIKNEIFILLFFSFNFVYFPILSTNYLVSKVYFFVIIFFIFSFIYFLNIKNIYISKIYFIFLFLNFVFFVSSFFQNQSFNATINTLIFFLIIIFSILFSDLVKKNKFLTEKIIDSIILVGLLGALLGFYEYCCYLILGSTNEELLHYLIPSGASSRIGGPYGQPNLFSLFLSSTLILFFYRYISLDNSRKKTKILKYIPLFLVSFVFYSTGSRGGFLGFFFSLAFLSWFFFSRECDDIEKNSAKKELKNLLLCVALSFVLYHWINHINFSSDIGRSFSTLGLNGDSRFILWVSSFLIFLDNPWFGIGLGNFGFIQSSYGPNAKEILFFLPYEAMQKTNWSHNEIMQILAEGGIFAFSLTFGLLSLYIYSCLKNIAYGQKIKILFLFSHILIVPFLIQAMFSWPLRFPPLLVLFFLFLSILLAQFPVRRFTLQPFQKFMFLLFLFISMSGASYFFVQEQKITCIKETSLSEDGLEILDNLQDFSQNSYGYHRVLSGLLPLYLEKVLFEGKGELVEKILPLYENLTLMEGARWQWYNLARLYLKVGREDDARLAINKAIDLMPSDDVSWNFLHYLNMLAASKATGRPVEDFVPEDHELDITFLEMTNGEY